MADASDVATRKVKQLILLVDKMEQAQVALDAKLKATEDELTEGRKRWFRGVTRTPWALPDRLIRYSGSD